MDFNPKIFGIKYNHLYEILATTISFNMSNSTLIPNTAAMGIRLTETNRFKINPYPTTQTFINLKNSGIITLNFVEDVYLYALATLKEGDSPNLLKEFPSENYDFIDISENRSIREIIDNKTTTRNYRIPYVKRAWGIIICQVVNERKKVKRGQLGKTTLTEFEIEMLLNKRFAESYKLFNRAENIALEMIILATRLEVAHNQNDHAHISELHNQFLSYKTKLQRFSRNKSANKTLELIEDYIKKYIE